MVTNFMDIPESKDSAGAPSQNEEEKAQDIA